MTNERLAEVKAEAEQKAAALGHVLSDAGWYQSLPTSQVLIRHCSVCYRATLIVTSSEWAGGLATQEECSRTS